MAENTQGPGLTWLYFALMTVASWGLYGVLLHTGQLHMSASGGDATVARYKAFLFVGLAYFLTAVLAPLGLLMLKGEAFSAYNARGMGWSLVAGTAGAIGAFGVLLAFGARGTPPVVMSIIFAGAPIVNAVVSLLLHPPAEGWRGMNVKFLAGIVLAAVGAYMVVKFKPNPAPAKPPAVATQAAAPGGAR